MKLIKNAKVSEKLQGQATTADYVNDVVSWEGASDGLAFLHYYSNISSSTFCHQSQFWRVTILPGLIDDTEVSFE